MTPAGLFDDVGFPLDASTADAYRAGWSAIGDPGCWWTGLERVAIAAETRAATTCEICRRRNAAPSPFAVSEPHAPSEALSAGAVDAIHRVSTDSGRLTRRWYERVVGGEMSAEEFIEAVAIVATTLAVDTFVRGLGGTPAPLPAPRSGAPSRTSVATAPGDAWVPMRIDTDTGRARKRSGPLMGVSALPRPCVPARLVLARGSIRPPGAPLSAAQTHFLAAVLSVANDCPFCLHGHVVGLERAALPDEQRIDYHALLAGDLTAAEAIPAGATLGRFAQALTGADDDEIGAARAALIDALGVSAFIFATDVLAQTVAANCLANATGIRRPTETVELAQRLLE